MAARSSFVFVLSLLTLAALAAGQDQTGTAEVDGGSRSRPAGGPPGGPQGGRGGGRMDVCNDDRIKFCSTEQGLEASLKCLSSHSSEIVADCKTKVDKMLSELSSLHQACDSSISKFCSSATTENATVTCVAQNLAFLETACIKQISTSLSQLLSGAQDAVMGALLGGPRPIDGIEGSAGHVSTMDSSNTNTGSKGTDGRDGSGPDGRDAGSKPPVGGPLGAALIAVSVVLFLSIIANIFLICKARRARNLGTATPVATSAALVNPYPYPYPMGGYMEPVKLAAGFTSPAKPMSMPSSEQKVYTVPNPPNPV